MNKNIISAIGALASVLLLSSSLLHAAERYNVLTDAVEAQVKRWQSGDKARAIVSSDGKVIFPFGQAMPKLTCSPSRACDIEMEPGETPRKVILADQVNWTWQAADSIEGGKTVNHVVLQPKDSDLETNLIITTDRRSYHIKLFSPKVEGAYLNRVGFYYPEGIVTSWDEKAGRAAADKARDESPNVLPAPVSPEKLAFDYRLDGNADFKPVRVINDGERVYITMPDDIKHSEYPTLSLIDEKGQFMVVNYRRSVDERSGTVSYIVDKLFNKAQLIRGDEKVVITWKRKERSFWQRTVGSN